MHAVSGQGDLFEGTNSSEFRPIVVGMEMEMVTRAALEEIKAKTPLTGKRRAQEQIAMALARNIDRGNAKGRAIANEAMQLQAVLDALAPDEAKHDDDLPDELKDLLNAFASGPRISPPPPSDTT